MALKDTEIGATAGVRREDDEVVRSGGGKGEIFADLMERRISRRGLLKAGAASAAGALVLTVPGVGNFPAEAQGASMKPGTIKFTPIAPQPVDSQQIVLSEGHTWAPLLRWGDPIRHDAPEFDPENQTPEAQAQQFGYNCDYIGFHSLPFVPGRASKRGLLWVNHEYTNEELMFAGYEFGNPTPGQVNIGLAAHGGTIVELSRDANGIMYVDMRSEYNRRITGTTPMRLSGPAAEHEWVTTQDDPYAQTVLGTLNNCAGGITPWGTVLTCEENFHQYFGNLQNLDSDDPRYDVHDRYGLPEEDSERLWERFHPRFNIAVEPNEAFRFGWVVEIDPYNPEQTPVKRTAMGRFRHEGATFGYSPSGRVTFYSGDDAQFEYVYKFVSDNAWDRSKRGMNQNLLDEGVLYVATFNDDGSGEWLPLIYGEGPLTEENGFTSQGDVMIKTREAGDALGATKMDRPEDIQQNPVNKKVYIACTNNSRRGVDDNPGVDEANPRPENVNGHIIELTETDDDAVSTTFTWDIFILCGLPGDPSTYFAGFPKENVSPIAAPDNVNFDIDGNLWISTDGQPRPIGYADALHAVPTSGAERGNLQQFLAVVAGSECASFDFTDDNRNLFVAVQHPGEGGTIEEPVSTWPHDETGYARPTVIQVWADDGRKVGGGDVPARFKR
ncbi:MAG: PhoX family phosphatase [Chloroflexia bacterium]|nr:PhoX family phosphatase [Chloroflexia bacterium]